MQTCLICKKTVMEEKHWVHCSRFGQAICMKHCFSECKYRKDDHCGYPGREKSN